MGQPNLGDRKLIQTRVPKELDIDQIAHDAGYRYPGRYLADIVCEMHGFPIMHGPDLATGQEQLSA